MGQANQIVQTSIGSPRLGGSRHSSLGALKIVASQLGVHVIGFDPPDQSELLHRVSRTLLGRQVAEPNPKASLEQAGVHLENCRAALNDYLAGNIDAFQRLRLEPFGTSFQQLVWRQLRKIPFGSTVTYGTIAARIGNPGAVRAVGTACGRNPIVLAIPCHRVLAAGNAIGGFSAGLERKRLLLEHEGIQGYGR